MRFAFTDDQRAFAQALGDLLADQFPASRLREVWQSGTGHDPALWARLGEMGVLGMLVPQSAGGLGAAMVDAVLVFQALGRAAVPGPVIEHIVGAAALGATPHAAGAADGSTVVTVALGDEGPADGTVPDSAVAGSTVPDSTVPHGTVADAVVCGDGVLTGFTARALPSLDGGRQTARVAGGTVTPVPLDRLALADALALGTAAYLVGLGETMIAMGGDYARQREQFGQPIGAFQAVKHLLADALLQVEFAKAPTYRAAWSLSTGAPTTSRDVSMAKALAGDAAYRAGRASMQVHGGIGYTWEADLQLWMKKVWVLQRAAGDSRFHRRRVADAVLGRR